MANTLTITGFAANDGELRFTPNGKAVYNLSIPENHGYKNQQTGEWEKTGTTWRSVEVWGPDAEAAAEGVRKGDLLIIVGREELEEFQRKDGTSGAKLKFRAFQLAKVLKAPRQGQNTAQNQQWGGEQNTTQRPYQPQGGSQRPPQGGPQQGQQADPWGQQGGGNYQWGNEPQNDEPPF